MSVSFFFQAEDGIRDLVRSRGLGDVYKRQLVIIAVWIYSKRKKIPFLTLADLTAPSLALAYGLSLIHI